MNFGSRASALALGLGMAASATGLAQADVIEQTKLFDVAASSSGPNPDSDTLSFNQFNTVLGTLTGIQFELTATPGLTGTINFSSAEGGSASGAASATFIVSGPNGSVLYGRPATSPNASGAPLTWAAWANAVRVSRAVCW